MEKKELGLFFLFSKFVTHALSSQYAEMIFECLDCQMEGKGVMLNK